MSHKSKLAKKVQEEQPSIEQEIAQIFDKKQLDGETYYLVKYKSNEKKQWKPISDLQNVKYFLKQRMNYSLLQAKSKTSKQITTNQNKSKSEKSQDIEEEKQPRNIEKETSLPKKIHIAKEKNKNLNQQQSLNNFISISKSIVQEEKKEPIKEESNNQKESSKPKIKAQTLKLTAQIQTETFKKEIKVKNVNQAPKQQPKVNSVWVDKIKSINRIKGYELRNGQMFYDVQVLDNNGQNFFIPPLPSEIVAKFDAFKVAGFLQDCLLRDYAQKNKTK